MSVEVRPRRSYHHDSIRRHSLNMALMSDVSSKKPSRDSLCSTEPIRQVSLEEHLDPIHGEPGADSEAEKGSQLGVSSASKPTENEDILYFPYIPS